MGGIGIVKIEILFDLPQRETEFLTPQDHDHSAAITQGINAVIAGAPRRNETLVFVKPDRAGADSQVDAELGHRVELPCHLDRRFPALSQTSPIRQHYCV